MPLVSRKHLHFCGNGGIQLCLAAAGNSPRIPGITPGLGLVHYPRRPRRCRLTLRLASSRSAPRSGDRARGHLSQFRDDHMRERRRSARKTGGVVDHHGRPCEEAPTPAGRSPPPRKQRCGDTTDDPMPFAFANPLPLPTGRAVEPLSLLRRHDVGFSRRREPRAGHSGDERPDTWFLGQGRSDHPGFVSYSSLVGKKLGNSEFASSYLVALT
jgi:hypothetical protein